MHATLRRCLGEDRLVDVGGTIAWLKQPARFQNSADLAHYERGLELAGLAEA